MTICELTKEHAQDFLKMQLQLDEETDDMLFEAGERPNDIERVYRNIEYTKEIGSVVLVAYQDGKCVGFALANRGTLNRVRHSAYLVIGILKDYQGMGIGNALFGALIERARDSNIKRLELTVRTANHAGIALYEKYGFEVEGVKRCAMLVNGEYVDEYYMARIL